MPNELIATLIKFIPTILVGVIILGAVLVGFFRGFRKSTIFLIHYIGSLVVGFVLYFMLSKKIFTMDLNFLFSLIGGPYSQAHTFFDFVEIAINQTNFAEYSSIATNYYIQGVIQAIAGIAVSLVLGILCLVVVPILLRAILHLIYLIFYSERKHKKRIKAEEGDYKRRRLLGMAVGFARGLVCATLAVSMFTSLFFIIAGGNYCEKDEEPVEIDLLNVLGDSTGLDFNLYYNALKESRNTGVGALYEAIKIKGKPIDYYYFDLFSSTTFNTYEHSKEEVATLNVLLNATLENGATATLCLREEIAILINLVESLLETNAIYMDGGNIDYDMEKLLVEAPKIIDKYVNDSKLFSDILPLAIIGAVDEIQKGNISIHEDIDEFIKKNDLYSKVRQIDLPKDLSSILNTCVSLVKLLKVDETTGKIDFNASFTLESLLSLDSEVVEEIFINLGEISLITDIIFPVGTGLLFDMYQTQITEFGISTDDISLTNIDWKHEISNIGSILKSVLDLGIDGTKLMDTTVDPETGKTVQVQYLLDFISQTETKDAILDVVDSVMDSKLISQVMLVSMKKVISDLKVVNEDGSESSLNSSLTLVKENLNAKDENGNLLYNADCLKKDIHTLLDSCLGLLDLFSAFTENIDNPLKALANANIGAIRTALIGEDYKETGKVTGGIYQIRFLSGDLNDDGKLDDGMNAATDEMIEVLLKAYAGAFFNVEEIESVENWPAELSSLVDFIEVIQGIDGITELDFSQGIPTSLPNISDENINKLTVSATKSVLIGSLLKTVISDALSNVEIIVVNIERDEWLDSFDETGNVKAYGELNKILKAFIVLGDPDKQIDLNDSNSLLMGLSKLERHEVDKFTDSTILKDSLSNLVESMLYPDEDKELDSSIVWETTYNEDGTVLKDGEFQALVNILKIEKLKTEKDGIVTFDLEKIGDINTLASLESKDVDTITASQIVRDVLDEKVITVLYPEGNEDTPEVVWETIYNEDGTVKTKGELQAVVEILAIDVFKDEEGKVDINRIADPTVLSQLTSDNVDSITSSIIVKDMLDDKVVEMLYPDGGDLPDVVWETTYNEDGSVKEQGELQAIVNILAIDDLKDEEEKVNVERLGDIQVLSQLSSDEVDTITSSVIVKDMLDDKVISAIYPEGNEDVPEVVWETTYNEDGSVKEQGELQAIVNILTIDSLKDEEEKVDVNRLADPTVLSKLATDEVDCITSSAIVKDMLDDKVGEIIYPDGGEMPEVVWETTYKEDGSVKEQGEFQTIVNILAIENLKDDNGKVDVDKLSDIDTIAQLIKKNNDDSLNYSDVESMAHSKIVMSAMSEKISNISSGDVAIVVPAKLAYNKATNPNAWELWAHNVGYIYTEGEFGRMVYSLYCAREYVLTIDDELGQDKYEKLDSSNLIEGIIGMSEHSAVTNSLVMYATISNEFINQSSGENPTISIRQNAKITNENELLQNDNIVIRKNEVILALDVARGLNLTDFKNVNIEKIIDNLRESEETKEKLCKSNIMNKTVVKKLKENSEGTLKFPEEYSDIDNVNWYPLNASYWENSELNKVLTSVIHLSDGPEAGINIIGNEIKSNTNKLFRDLSNSVAGTSETKLNVVYQSEVMAYNITDKINDRKAQGDIEIRPKAYVAGNENNNLKQEEVELLVNLINEGNFKIDSSDANDTGKELNAENLLNLVEEQDYRAMMCFSNIINITVINKVTSNSQIKIPMELKDDEVVNLEDPDWYPADSLTVTSDYALWHTCELNNLLLAIHELQTKDSPSETAVIEVKGNDIEVNSEKGIYTLNTTANTNSSATKVEVVYESMVLAQTLSDYIINDSKLFIPKAYQTDDIHEKYDVIVNGRIIKSEVVTLVDSINILNITLDNDYVATPGDPNPKIKPAELKASHLTKQSEGDIDYIFSSAVISLKAAEILESKRNIEVPTKVEFMVERTDGVEEEAVYSHEIAELIKGLKDMNFDVDNEDDPFDLSEVASDKLEFRLSKSDIFHATMSVQLKDHVDYVPKYYYQSYVDESSQPTNLLVYLGEKQYLTSSEISNAVLVLQDLGFTDTEHAMENVDSSFISKLSEEQVANIDKSGIITALITHKLTGVTIPNSKTVVNKVDMLKGDPQELIINGDELKALAIAIIKSAKRDGEGNSVGLDINNIANLSMNDFDDAGLAIGIETSYILRATLSDKITNVSGLRIPDKDINGYSISDSLNYLKANEINALIKSFKTLGLDFDSINSNTLANTDIAKVNANIDDMLNSAIIHSLLSDNLIKQKQTIGSSELAIVTEKYMKENGTLAFDVAKEVSGTKYVLATEIKLLLTGLDVMNINMSNASNISITDLSAIAATPAKVSGVKNSAILSTIIGNILIEQLPVYSASKTKYEFNRVDNGMPQATLSQEDIDAIFATYPIS